MDADEHTGKNDFVLWHKIKEGDAQAFKSLFLRYYDPLIRFVNLLHHNPVLAEEAVQEVFAKIWEKRNELTIKTSVKYYLYNACRNQAYNLISQKANQHNAISELLANILTEERTPEHVFYNDALSHDIQEAIDALPPKAREVFLMKYFRQAKHKEIAQSMNISESMVEKHASNALKHLRKKLATHAISLAFAIFLFFF